MSFLKQLAYTLGLIAGLATVGVAGTVVLTYLFTGRVPAVKMADGEKPKMQLFTPDEIVVLIRKQASNTEAAAEVSADTGG